MPKPPFDSREFFAGLKTAEEKMNRAMLQVARESIAEITGQAVKLAPVDEGTLRGSGSYFVQGAFVRDTLAQVQLKPKARPTPNRSGGPETAVLSDHIRAVVGFNTSYAAVQHEEDYRHPNGGEMKYLEKALREVRPKIQRVAKRFARRAGF